MAEVSIVVPLFNVRYHLDQLNSNLASYYEQGYELIFVEDGSDDPVEAEIKLYFPNSTYIFQENKGAAAARNAGVNLANSKYIQLMDADDTIAPDKIPIQLVCAEEHQADVVYSDWRNLYIEADGKQTYKPWNIEKQHSDYIQRSLRGWWTPTPCPLIRRQAYRDIGGMNESMKVGEDTYFFHELAMRGYRFQYCPGKFFTYHRYLDKPTLSQVNQRLYNLVIFDILKNDFQILTESGRMTPEYKKIILEERFHVARDMMSEDFVEGIKIHENIRAIDPTFKPILQTILYRIGYALIGFKYTEMISIRFYRRFRRLFIKDRRSFQ